ncbi:MAG: hypothetical protein K2Z81_07730, partial [Cyanobacteria bacterium]|nr:hypothetical protein [Cyanobacteriota bacterium]
AASQERVPVTMVERASSTSFFLFIYTSSIRLPTVPIALQLSADALNTFAGRKSCAASGEITNG